MPQQNRKKNKPRWYKARGRNVNRQTIKRRRTDARTKRVDHYRKLMRKGYFNEEV